MSNSTNSSSMIISKEDFKLLYISCFLICTINLLLHGVGLPLLINIYKAEKKKTIPKILVINLSLIELLKNMVIILFHTALYIVTNSKDYTESKLQFVEYVLLVVTQTP